MYRSLSRKETRALQRRNEDTRVRVHVSAGRVSRCGLTNLPRQRLQTLPLQWTKPVRIAHTYVKPQSNARLSTDNEWGRWVKQANRTERCTHGVKRFELSFMITSTPPRLAWPSTTDWVPSPMPITAIDILCLNTIEVVLKMARKNTRLNSNSQPRKTNFARARRRRRSR